MPNPWWTIDIRQSLNHSHANHALLGRLCEKGSTRGAIPVRRIMSPVTMCQPVSLSPSSRAPMGPIMFTASSVTLRPPSEGSIQRTAAGSRMPVSGETLSEATRSVERG